MPATTIEGLRAQIAWLARNMFVDAFDQENSNQIMIRTLRAGAERPRGPRRADAATLAPAGQPAAAHLAISDQNLSGSTVSAGRRRLRSSLPLPTALERDKEQ